MVAFYLNELGKIINQKIVPHVLDTLMIMVMKDQFGTQKRANVLTLKI